jgi:hypothetical protein
VDTFWGNFGQFISTHFGTVSIVSINEPIFLQKFKPLYPHSKYLFGIHIPSIYLVVEYGRKELGI